ncbi:Pkinase-domain-containing protein [Neocallimastix californiae]|jgi:tRNA A-37 threonylcarbamoyl transferase component Bud32|uniref:cAMP-dependent protein kinase n=1 Tax=Neocallimastix californiae TaxID=1754190 RepID=A0A1Y2EMB2_9FUNG|nr:Pkinase-domain-containing protein [Neocallimastix californiae]|eukprot:ORY72711.1 Pkinase-domain-containing protein [Neocallimastix californiae]
MASIINKNSITSTHTLLTNSSKGKKQSKASKGSSNNILENEINRSLKSFGLNISTKSLNNNNNLCKSSLSNSQNINNLFKLTSPTTPTLLSPTPKKQSSIIYIHSKDYSNDSDSENISSKPTETESIPSEPVTPSIITPKNSNKNNLNLNINLLLKDIKALNFKYKNHNNFENIESLNNDNNNNNNKINNNIIIKNDNTNTNTNNNNNDIIKNNNKKIMANGENKIDSSKDPITNAMSSLTVEYQSLILKSPTPPPTTKLPDIPPPSRPAPHYLPPPPPLNKNEINLDSFDVIKTIGTGSFGRVHLVRSHSNKKFYAMKAIQKKHIVKEQQIEHIKEEKQILEELRHPLFIHLLGTFQTKTHLFIVTNYIAGGELFAVLKKKTRFINNVAKFYAAEVTVALDYLHSKNIIYRDLKPENIMLDITGHIKLVDLGFAKHVPDVTYTLCGTPEYMAPEVILSKAYGKAVDWYSLGILIYEMLCGYPPFYDQDQLQLYKKILSGKIYWPSYIKSDAKHLIKQLITPDLTKRYGNLKNGAEDIKEHKWFSGVEWSKVAKLAIAPPFIPEIYSEGDTRHFQRYSEPCDKEYYQSHDQEGLSLDDPEEEENYDEYFKDF